MTAALSKSSKCSSVKEFLLMFSLMLFMAENPASHTYVLPSMVSTFLQHLTISGNCPFKSIGKKFFQRTAAGQIKCVGGCMLDSTGLGLAAIPLSVI